MSTSPTAHSIFGASSAKRWMACPASIAASAGLPNESSPYAAEGTMLHDIAAQALMVYRADPHDVFAWNDLELTAEQIGVVQRYVDTIREDTEQGLGEPWQRFMIEERVSLPGLHPQFFGTNDCSVVRAGKLTVYDLKCGAGVAVEVDEDGRLNPQLGYYMLGAIEALGGHVDMANVVLPPHVVELEIVVVQPRLGGVKRRDVAVTELLDLAADLAVAAHMAETPGAAPMQGGSHCKFCPARRGADGKRCKGLEAHAKAQAKLDFAPADMTDHDLAAVLAEAEAIETWLTAVREEAKARMQAGTIAPGWRLRTGSKGKRNWIDATKAQLALMAWGFSVDHVAPRKLVSPAEVERLAKLHHAEEIDLADMVERKPGAVTVVRESAASEFGKVEC